MKKFFTLVSVAMAAMSLNAQVEKYTAITFSQEVVDNGDGTTSTKNVTTLSAEFAAAVTQADGTIGEVATNATEEGSVINFGTENITAKAVGGSTPADVPDNAGDNTMTHADMNEDGTVNSWNEIKWQQKNQGDIQYAWVQGTGNPSAEIKAEKIESDGVATTYIDDNGVEQFKYRPVYTVYNPDGSLGAPKVGLHYQFTAKVAGTMKVAIWINKGNRNFYVVDGTTGLPVPYKNEGYINGQNEKVLPEGATDSVTQKKWLSHEEIQAIHDAAKVGEDGVDSAPYIVGAGNQAYWGNVIFEMEAGKTYYVFNDNTQLGFQGYEFTPAGGSDAIVEVVKDNENAPMFNVAGQQVTKGYKGIVIQNGKKYILR